MKYFILSLFLCFLCDNAHADEYIDNINIDFFNENSEMNSYKNSNYAKSMIQFSSCASVNSLMHKKSGNGYDTVWNVINNKCHRIEKIYIYSLFWNIKEGAGNNIADEDIVKITKYLANLLRRDLDESVKSIVQGYELYKQK